MNSRKRKQPTYSSILKKASKKVWPGCGDGRKMSCGTIHDFSYSAYYGGPLISRFLCTENYYNGCPQPHPDKIKKSKEI